MPHSTNKNVKTEANEIQDLYLAGQQGAAMMKVPPALIDEVALVGPKERIKERLSRWQNSPITTLNITVTERKAVEVMAELVL